MVCQACEKKLSKVACPEKWRDSKSDKQGESSGRKINENKLLSGAKRYQPYGQKKCKTCKQNLHQDGMYCQACAYAKGLCSMCGKQMLDVKSYKQSTQ
ncbi:hypothetical protein HYH02_012838 [Chlamydomonas schloesseri]|uniref:Cysteine-rich PDZ-binding protein n=1 Tax=Chlamydomonas schloesseri TaxID=2026947 RepID=A0A835VXN8_9CHLO|nr:hypothetical protein HYH02_012838 [Chlamydomonas schloesseri]|eukprot:KAG2433137.1 hypothetical protein HYH02_012838 [Chlamydomonas schloesseri]